MTMYTSQNDTRNERARAWFETLRDRIVAAFEAVEDALPDGAAGRSRRGAVYAHALEPHRSYRRATDLGFTRDR